MSVSCECYVLSGRGLCVGLITRSRGVLPSGVCLSVIVKPRQKWHWSTRTDGPKRGGGVASGLQ